MVWIIVVIVEWCVVLLFVDMVCVFGGLLWCYCDVVFFLSSLSIGSVVGNSGVILIGSCCYMNVCFFLLCGLFV